MNTWLTTLGTLAPMSVDPKVQQIYSAIQRHFIESGRAPHIADLAAELGVDIEEARRLQREIPPYTAAWRLGDTDFIESFAPFYNLPTNVAVSIDGEQKWFAQCGQESLVMSLLFPGKELRVEAKCLDCGDRVLVRTRDDQVLDVDPPEAVGLFNVAYNPEVRPEGTSGTFI